MTSTANDRQKPSWLHAALWLLCLGPFFFASYGFANWWASQQTVVPQIVFGWERHIPFVPWTIIPYWVVDILYAGSLFVCVSKWILKAHAKRLITAQIIAVACFIFFPLRFSFSRPVIENEFFYWLFEVLASFDQPFNQAPSLHIALIIILWACYVPVLHRALRWPFHGLCLLIGVSVLTTYQHHFIDVPTGALLGFFAIWVWPFEKEVAHKSHRQDKGQRRQQLRLAAYYNIAALLFGSLAFVFAGYALWLIWPMVSMLLVASVYLGLVANGFQKKADGSMTMAARWLLFPYLLGARVNALIWTRNIQKANHITDGTWMGQFPTKKGIEESKYQSVVDLTAEFVAPKCSVAWHSFPCLDLLTPDIETVREAAKTIEACQSNGPVLVACALGYSRSAVAVMAWLLMSGRAADVEAAIATVKRARPTIVLKQSDKELLARLYKESEAQPHAK